MARPTSDKKDSKIILRINAETRDYIENEAKRMGCSLSDCVRRIISGQDSYVVQNNDEYKTKFEELSVLYDKIKAENESLNGNSTDNGFDLPSEALKDIESMSTFCGMSLHDALVEFDRLLNEGALVIGDEINVELPSWTKRITEVCHDRCISVESMGKKIVEMIERGQI